MPRYVDARGRCRRFTRSREAPHYGLLHGSARCSERKHVKGMTIAAAVTMVLAVLIGLSPLLVLLSGAGGPDFGQVGWVYMFFTIPAGALLGLVAVGLSTAVSIIGISRARSGSVPRLLIAIGGLAFMILSIIGIVGSILASLDGVVSLIFLVLGIVGFILAVVTGFIAPARQLTITAVGPSAGPESA